MEPTPISLENTTERVAVLEHVLEGILPMLIEGSLHLPDIRATLQELRASPPPALASSAALTLFLDNVLDTIPSEP